MKSDMPGVFTRGKWRRNRQGRYLRSPFYMKPMLRHLKERLYDSIILTELGRTIINPIRIINLFDKQERGEFFRTLLLKYKYMRKGSRHSPGMLVEQGYDKISEQYTQWTESEQNSERSRVVEALILCMPEKADLLDLGCGSGVPSTRRLADRFNVTGVDFSSESIKRARSAVPGVTFIRGDMGKVQLAPACFDIVTAFYSIFHIPRHEQPAVLEKVALSLRPGGLAILTMGTSSIKVHVEENWFGTPMYWSTFDSDTNIRLVEDTGLKILRAKKLREYFLGRWNTFLWIVAQKPTGEDFSMDQFGSDFIECLDRFPLP